MVWDRSSDWEQCGALQNTTRTRMRRRKRVRWHWAPRRSCAGRGTPQVYRVILWSAGWSLVAHTVYNIANHPVYEGCLCALNARAAASRLLHVGMIRGGARTATCWDPLWSLRTGPQRGETLEGSAVDSSLSLCPLNVLQQTSWCRDLWLGNSLSGVIWLVHLQLSSIPVALSCAAKSEWLIDWLHCSHFSIALQCYC